MTGVVEAVCVSERRGTSKIPVEEVVIRADHGIVGDVHAGSKVRQISILARESIETMRAAIPDLADGAFAENVIVAGVDLGDVSVGARIGLGESVVLEVTRIGKTCHDQCDIGRTVGECIMPKVGVFCRVVAGGSLRAGDTAGFVAEKG